MAILVAADFTPGEWAAWWPELQASLPGERLVRDRTAVPDVADEDIDVALVANPPADALRNLPGLRLVQSLWAGVDGLLADPSLPAEVLLARMVDPSMNAAMAQTALWAVLALHRGFFAYAGQQQRADWRPQPQRRADEVSVAVLGLGQMGRATAQRLAANGYRVSGCSTLAKTLDGITTHAGPASLAPVLAAAQIVVNLLPLTAATRGLLNRQTLAMMPRGAGLVNLARGAHVVEAACSKHSTAATSATPCPTCSTPSRCRRTTRCGAIRRSACCRTSRPSPTRAARPAWRRRTCARCANGGRCRTLLIGCAATDPTAWRPYTPAPCKASFSPKTSCCAAFATRRPFKPSIQPR